MSAQPSLPIDAIRVGERCREDLGDLKKLAASIAGVGLLSPIGVTGDNTLVAGQRRLEACRLLGWTEVPVHVVTDVRSARDLFIAERDENVCREEMKLSERVVLGRKLEELERPRAKERQGARTDLKQHSEKFTESKRDRSGETREIVGDALGMSGPSYDRAKKVVALAEEGKQEAIEALAEMDRTGKITPAYEKATGTKLTTKRVRRGTPGREKLREVLGPVHRHLKSWQPEALSGTTPAEARRLLKIVQDINAVLFEVERALESRTVTPRALR